MEPHACHDAAVVFTMVADDHALIDIVSGTDEAPGIEEALGDDVHVSLSTISTELAAPSPRRTRRRASDSCRLRCSGGRTPLPPRS